MARYRVIFLSSVPFILDLIFTNSQRMKTEYGREKHVFEAERIDFNFSTNWFLCTSGTCRDWDRRQNIQQGIPFSPLLFAPL